jgi:hypothetical protein
MVTPNTITTNDGFVFKPDGATTTLFLAATGYRGGGGNISGSTNQEYWTSSYDTGPLRLNIKQIAPYPTAGGFAIRCVQ